MSIPRCAKHGTHYTDGCSGCDACREVHRLREAVTAFRCGGACAANTCRQPATVRLYHRVPGAMALVSAFCEKHAVAREALGWER